MFQFETFEFLDSLNRFRIISRIRFNLVGVTGFKPATSCTPSKRAIKLRHTPNFHKTIAKKNLGVKAMQLTLLRRPGPVHCESRAGHSGSGI